MKKQILIFVVLCLMSCSAEVRLNRLLSRHPELKIPDTVIFGDTLIEPMIQADTLLFAGRLDDTVFIEKDRLEVSIRRIHDTLYIRGKCKADTLIIIRKIPVEKIRIVKPDKLSAFIGEIPWLAAGLIMLCVLTIVLVIKFKK